MSKEITPPAPSLLRGSLIRVEPLAAQKPENVLSFYKKNKDFLRSFSPTWPSHFFEESFWQRKIWASSQDWQNDLTYRFVIKALENDEEVIGNINLSQICRGAFQNAYLGYGIDQELQGRGLMTEAVGLVVSFAFEKLKLHRVQANTLVENIGSQRVLLKNNFVEEGLAKSYLEINGIWADHKLFACINPNYEESS